MSNMSGSGRRKVGADNEHPGVDILFQQIKAGVFTLMPIEIRAAAPVGTRHLARVMDAVAGNQRFLPL